MRGVLPKISSTAGLLAAPEVRRRQVHHHRGHDGREHQRREAAPHHAPVTRVAVDLGEDVAEEVGDREEQHAGKEGDRAEQRHLRRSRPSPGRSDWRTAARTRRRRGSGRSSGRSSRGAQRIRHGARAGRPAAPCRWPRRSRCGHSRRARTSRAGSRGRRPRGRCAARPRAARSAACPRRSVPAASRPAPGCGPDCVPLPSRSPGLRLQPFTVWCVSICASVHHESRKFDCDRRCGGSAGRAHAAPTRATPRA